MLKKIGLTGGTGFLGQYLIREFGDQYDFVVPSSRTDSKKLIKKATYILGGQYCKDFFCSAFQECETVIHLGAVIPEKVTLVGTVDQYITDLTTTEDLLMAMKELDIHKLIYSSSIGVYGDSSMPLNEEMIPAPGHCYGVLKAATEMLIQMYDKKYGISATILRFPQILGYKKYKSPGLYSMLMENAFYNKPITIYGSGISTRNYIYVKDAVKSIICALETPKAKGVFNIGMPENISNLDLAKAFVQGFNSTGEIVFIPEEKEDTRCFAFDVSKAASVLGFETEYDAIEMAKDIYLEMKKVEL